MNHLLTTLLILTLFTSITTADTPTMLCDFETGINTNGPIGGGTGFFRHQSGIENHLPIAIPGANTTNYCVEYETQENSEAGLSFYIDNPETRTLIEEANGANRFRAWIKLPVGCEQGHDWNFHIGTYTRDPTIPSNIQGTHYYHVFNIPGSDYWTRIIANNHPQHLTGSKITPEVNPTSPGWDYYDGFTRFYFHCSGGTYPTPGTWSWFIDEVEFYNETETENAETITSLSCSYFGNGHFQLNWHGNSQYNHNNHHYEVRYSASPITNANYDSATIAPGCSDISRVPGAYNWMSANTTIPITSGTAYFAVKDTEPGYNNNHAKIDYPTPNNNQICGDINNDNNINSLDLIKLLNIIVTGQTISPCIGDTDGNQELNILDVRRLIIHINNPTTPLGCPC